MYIWCSVFLCLAVSAGYIDAVLLGFSQTKAGTVTISVALAGDDAATDATTITLAEDHTGTITTFAGTGAGGTEVWSSDNAAIIIDSATGAVTATLDYETDTSMTAGITFTEGSATGTITLTLTVTNVVDPPVFLPASTAETVLEASKPGTTVTTVTGSDADGAKTVTYEISADGNKGTVFEVVKNADGNGEIKIATDKTVARATLKVYSLEVLAKNTVESGTTQQTGTTVVLIGVCSSESSSAAMAVATSLSVLLAVAIAILP